MSKEKKKDHHDHWSTEKANNQYQICLTTPPVIYESYSSEPSALTVFPGTHYTTTQTAEMTNE